MKYFQKIGLRFGAIVAVAFAGNVMGSSITDYGVNSTTYSGDLTINDTDYSDGKAVVLTSTTSSGNFTLQSGIVRVGAASKVNMTDGAESAVLGVIAPSSDTFQVQSHGILEITAATPDCVKGHTEIMAGGKIQVDASVTIPAAGDASTDVFGGLKFHSGSVLVLGPGANWQRDIVLETES